MDKQKRESFRVEYPRSYFPTINIGNKTFDILDASEFGIKFYYKENSAYNLGDTIAGTITFADNDQFNLKAKVIRIDKLFISIELSTPLPLSKIRAEHLYLMQHFSEKKAYS